MISRIYSPDLYAEKNSFVINRLKMNRKDINRYSKKEVINIKNLNLNDAERWNFLNGLKLRGRSGKEIVFKNKTTPAIAQLLGFIITDGSLLSTEGRVKLCQMDVNLLYKYLDIINREYMTNLNLAFNGKEANLSSIPLRYILHNYYGIPLGKKVRTVEAPSQVINSNDRNVLKRFIAGLFDGDGYVQYYYLRNKLLLDHAHFCISTSSHNLIRQSALILERLGIKCSISKRNDGRLTLQTAGFSNSFKFYEQIIPLIFHKERKKTADRIFLGNDFIEKLTVHLNQNLRFLFKEIIKRKLDRELLQMSSTYRYINSLRSIESWTYPSKAGKVRSVYVYRACKLLNKSPSAYISSNQLKLIEGIQNEHQK